MARIGKISVIKKDYSSAFPTLETSLRQNGMAMFPGTKRGFSPARRPDGSYITGLSPELQKKFEEALGGGVDLSPRSKFWNVSIPPENGEAKAQMVFLDDKDHVFNLDVTMEAITYHWLKAHPLIASSLEAYERGEYPHDTLFFINDEEYENEQRYKKAKVLNDAIIKFTSFSVEKRKKIVRLMGMPITDDSKETVVYNMGDSFLKQATVLSGPYKGMSPITVFEKFSNLGDEQLEVADLVEKVITNQIYREGRGGAIFEGDIKIAVDKQALIEELLSESGQEQRLELEKRLKVKMIAQV
jgi:hypothetical protein